jgi:putative DNA-binding protein
MTYGVVHVRCIVQLADLQADIATAVVEDAIPASASLLTGGGDPTRRFAIHRRHYAASLARSLVERFAATVWLTGADFITEAAMRFVRQHPPTRPCISEYGDEFPAYLVSCAGTRLPYIEQFARLDWHLGRLAIAVDAAPLYALPDCEPARLADTRLSLQHSAAYIALDWPLDELIQFYLSGAAPKEYELRNESVWLELRGSRGELWFTRLTQGDYEFRRALANGVALGHAAEMAVRVDESLNPGLALLAMLHAALVTGLTYAEGGES